MDRHSAVAMPHSNPDFLMNGASMSFSRNADAHIAGRNLFAQGCADGGEGGGWFSRQDRPWG
jgi:hypothetical protein